MDFDFTSHIKRSSNGSVDIKATMVELKTVVEQAATEEKQEHESIDRAVKAVFAKYPETVWTMDPLSNYAAKEMGVLPGNHSKMVEKIQNYIRTAEKVFLVQRGRSGIKLLGSAFKAA